MRSGSSQRKKAGIAAAGAEGTSSKGHRARRKGGGSRRGPSRAGAPAS
ncbi:hypothetical protein MUK42_06490 [Musa troglodytarum]|uniref:Uncharacterized protein n=1 Tax=Musa troglodytarum TaxID=320322 RepID=A0A9E7HDY9_9LILI|nr:hypothetical protein MUK42_06490 [Musa troglodytarum]